MLIQPKKFEYNTNLVTIEAFNQHQILYHNYISKVNSEINEMHVSSFNANGVLLHELFFENIGTPSNKTNEVLSNVYKFSNRFGRYYKWEDNFKDLATKSKPGWILLIYDFVTESYRNVAIESHDMRLIYNCKIIICLDVWEHSFFLDYKTDKKSYINKFIECINWDVVQSRILEV